jgi:hypothetical protein
MHTGQNFIAPENSVPQRTGWEAENYANYHFLHACGAIPVSSGNQRTEQLRWEATANGQTPKQNRAGAKPWEALHGRHFQFQLRVRSRYGADNVRKLVVYTSGRIDHDAVNARGNRGVNGETPI